MNVFTEHLRGDPSLISECYLIFDQLIIVIIYVAILVFLIRDDLFKLLTILPFPPVGSYLLCGAGGR
jgi:hypothetical protein